MILNKLFLKAASICRGNPPTTSSLYRFHQEKAEFSGNEINASGLNSGGKSMLYLATMIFNNYLYDCKFHRALTELKSKNIQLTKSFKPPYERCHFP